MKTCLIIVFGLISFNIVAQNKQPKVDTASMLQDTILTNVDDMPSFNGGEELMYKWLAGNIKYPQLALQKGISRTVIVSFIVEKDGSITNVGVLKGIGGGCDEEASRVVKNMPKWKPGKQKGIPVRVRFVILYDLHSNNNLIKESV